MVFRNPRALSSALAALESLQPRALGFLNTVDPLVLVSRIVMAMWCYMVCYCIRGYWYVIVNDSIHFNFHSTSLEGENMLLKLKLNLLYVRKCQCIHAYWYVIVLFGEKTLTFSQND